MSVVSSPVLGLSAAFAELAESISRGVVVVRGGPGSSGSGVIWDCPGLVITNHHVVPGPVAQVILGAGRRLAARVSLRAPELDLVALEVSPDSGLPLARVGDSTALRAGDLVLAVGNPMGEHNAATLGMLSAPGAGADLLRVGINLRPGNSGGALANARGEIVGIPNMVVGRGLALAVPSSVVQRFLLGEQPPSDRLDWL
jgi:serine protease Do